jgi:putative ABC transport system substrate-binding protein
LDRRVFVGALTAAVFGVHGRAFPQKTERLPRVGVLVSATPPHPFADAFRRGLQPLGYVEGENIAIEWRYTEGKSDRAAALARDLVQLGVDVIVAHFTPAVRAAMAATQTIPIVMAPAGAPVQTGFVDSLAHPGGNVTGLSGMDAELGGKRLQLIREVIPNLARVAVLASSVSTDPFSRPFLDDMQAAATIAGIRLVPVLVNGPNDFENAFAAMKKAEAQAVIVQGLFDPHRAIILELAAKHRLPVMSGNQETTAAGRTLPLDLDPPNSRNRRKPAYCAGLRKSAACGDPVLPRHRGQIRRWHHRSGRQRQHIAIPILPLFA